jgi:hypothetical protein
MDKEILQKDELRFDSRMQKLKWDGISFCVNTAEHVKIRAGIQKRLQRFRRLREVLQELKRFTFQHRGPTAIAAEATSRYAQKTLKTKINMIYS